ncbi:MAG: hypothetical protein KatS3mg124_1466 [Porticoccaceae bacterium]|nr:MAG: hypothetical protein KatS3mg124_1466 [Porticoccaceae bacterium]
MAEAGLELGYEDLRLDRASTGESLLAVTLRLWVLERALVGRARLPDWRGGLAAAGLGPLAETVVEPLFEFLWGNHYGLEVVPLCHRELSAEERALLTWVALLQRGRRDEVRRLLAGYTFPATARVILPLLERLAEAMAAAGLALPGRLAPPPADPAARRLRLH